MNENGNDTMANDLDQEKQNVSRVVQKGKNAIRVAKKLKSLKKGKNAIGVAKKMAALKSIAAFIAANPSCFCDNYGSYYNYYHHNCVRMYYVLFILWRGFDRFKGLGSNAGNKCNCIFCSNHRHMA